MKDIDFSCGWGSNYIHLLKWTEELKDSGYCFSACHTADTGVGLEVMMFPLFVLWEKRCRDPPHTDQP